MNLLRLAALCTVFTTLSTEDRERRQQCSQAPGGPEHSPLNPKALPEELQGVEGPRGTPKELCKGFAQLFARQCTQNSTQ